MTNIYKDAQKYLNKKLKVEVQPESDETPERYPIVTLNITQETSVKSLEGEALPATSIRCGVWGETYISTKGFTGVLDLADKLHAAMLEKHYIKTRTTEPYRDANGQWHVNVVYFKKTKTF